MTEDSQNLFKLYGIGLSDLDLGQGKSNTPPLLLDGPPVAFPANLHAVHYGYFCIHIIIILKSVTPVHRARL